VVFSSSVIPGNERSVQYLKDMLYRAGVKVYHYQMMDLHAGGHAKQDDLNKILDLLKPKFLIPHHGQYSMMVTLGELGKARGVAEENVIIADNGQVVHLAPENWWFDKKNVQTNYIMVDGLGVGDVGEVVLRDRQNLAKDGMFVIIVVVDKQTGAVRGSPDIISRGFVYLRESKELLKQVRKHTIEIVNKSTGSGGAINWIYIRDNVKNAIGDFLFMKTERRPMVLPVIIEV
jgi:ribonuclease J